jgi:DnaK suppressor protein
VSKYTSSILALRHELVIALETDQKFELKTWSKVKSPDEGQQESVEILGQVVRSSKVKDWHLMRGAQDMETSMVSLLAECKRRLLQEKAEILNRVKEARANLNSSEDKGGDEADQTVRVLAEAELLTLHDRLRGQLLEIEMALSRIESGTYGICEETDEMIEPERLKAIPWTRLSIEGAEIRESMQKRYARS